MSGNTKLGKSDFEAATGTVSGLNFRGQDLRAAKAPKDTRFQACDFSDSDFSGTDLSGLIFDNCLFQMAKFKGAILVGCSFVNNTSLHGAVLEGVEATSAKFINSNMESVEATGGDFYRSDFSGTTLRRGIFDRANLSEAVGFEPDQTSVYRTVFAGKKLDAWTSLRYEYTGLKLLLSIVPPTIFMISLLAEAYANLGASYYFANAHGSPVCGEDGNLCEAYAIWQVLLGQREGPIAVTFVIYAVVYNILRFALTMKVAALAAAEDRSHVTPPNRGYLGIRSLNIASNVVRIAKYGMLLLFAFNMWNLVAQTVVLPSPRVTM